MCGRYAASRSPDDLVTEFEVERDETDGVVLSAGETAMSVVVHRDGWHDATATLSVATESPAFVEPTWISSARIRRPLLALTGCGAVVGLWAGYRARRRRRGHPGPGRHGDEPESSTTFSGIDELALRRQRVADLDDVGRRVRHPRIP